MADKNPNPWVKVVFAAETDVFGRCPECEEDYGDCPCPGPTMDEYEYEEINGVLMARLIAE